jgi:hypothetical protein
MIIRQDPTRTERIHVTFDPQFRTNPSILSRGDEDKQARADSRTASGEIIPIERNRKRKNKIIFVYSVGSIRTAKSTPVRYRLLCNISTAADQLLRTNKIARKKPQRRASSAANLPGPPNRRRARRGIHGGLTDSKPYLLASNGKSRRKKQRRRRGGG